MKTVGALVLIVAVGVMGLVLPARAEKILMADDELDKISAGVVGYCAVCADTSLTDNNVSVVADSGMGLTRIGARFGGSPPAGPNMLRGSHMTSMSRTSSMVMFNAPGIMVFISTSPQ